MSAPWGTSAQGLGTSDLAYSGRNVIMTKYNLTVHVMKLEGFIPRWEMKQQEVSPHLPNMFK